MNTDLNEKHVCFYCGNEAHYQFKNGKWCCAKTRMGCPHERKRISENVTSIHKYFKDLGYTLTEHPDSAKHPNKKKPGILIKYHGDESHAECVRIISMKLYEALKNEIALDDHARMLLEIAAILHDIGNFIRYDNHHLHSNYIIRNSEIFGLSRKDNTIVAEIAKYHKGSSVPQDEDSFQMLPRSDRMTILKLTAILRIADALDRGHIQKFSDFTIKVVQNTLEINTKKSKNTVLEKIALIEKAGMFESIFGYKVILL